MKSVDTRKQRILKTIRGEPTDRIPWVPRLDLWFQANRLAGTLPPRYRNASLVELLDDLDFGYHAVVPAFRELRGPQDDCHRALGIYNLGPMPCRTVLENVDCRARTDGDRTIVEYRTPVGNLRTVVLYDDTMRRAGISITHVEEYAFKGVGDYAPLGYLFENARVEPNYGGYREFAARVGERGIAVAFVSLAASPMHLLQRELMPLETFFYEMHDHPDALARLAAQIGGYWDRLLEVAAGCPAEVVFLGANYDASVTYPPFFTEHIAPWLTKFAASLHKKGSNRSGPKGLGE